jgi:hypothetical protein
MSFELCYFLSQESSCSSNGDTESSSSGDEYAAANADAETCNGWSHPTQHRPSSTGSHPVQGTSSLSVTGQFCGMLQPMAKHKE